MRHEPDILRILIADTKSAFCRDIRLALESKQGIQVLGEACTGPSVIKLTNQLRPRVLLIGIEMAQQLELLESIDPAIPLVVMVTTIEREQIIEALRLGAAGIVLREASPNEILDSIRSVKDGKYSISGEAIAIIIKALKELIPKSTNGVAAQGAHAFTARELEIIARITAGFSNRRVCEEFSISERTVKHHLTNIYNKIGVANRLELALFAINHRLIGNHHSGLSQASHSG